MLRAIRPLDVPIVPLSVASALGDIKQIDNDGRLSAVTRSTRLSQRRAQALADHLSYLFTQSRSVTIDGWTVTIQDMSYDPATNVVGLLGVTVRDVVGNLVELDPHRIFVNPPLLFPDENGPIERLFQTPDGSSVVKKYRLDPAACIIANIIEVAQKRVMALALLRLLMQ